VRGRKSQMKKKVFIHVRVYLYFLKHINANKINTHYILAQQVSIYLSSILSVCTYVIHLCPLCLSSHCLLRCLSLTSSICVSPLTCCVRRSRSLSYPQPPAQSPAGTEYGKVTVRASATQNNQTAEQREQSRNKHLTRPHHYQLQVTQKRERGRGEGGV